MRILISGASIAGPVLAYWLTRYGHDVTVVERAPRLRKTGGHSVDLFRPAMDISERMGVLPRIEAATTGTDRMIMFRDGHERPVTVDLGKVFNATSDRHVEIMRDDLSEIYYDAARDDVEYVFGDTITSITDDPADSAGCAVTFEHGAPRRFDLVVGADGLHSGVRQLVFGPADTAYAGAYLSVFSVPKELARDDEYLLRVGVGHLAGVYTARHLDDARAGFFFRSPHELDYHHRDVPRQQEILRERFAGRHPESDRWLRELDTTPAFYFDSITQLRMDSWSRGRVTLVGDAGYCPGPAVGGSTSLAVLGAYVLAGELASAGGDHVRAFAAYEREIGDLVRRSRAFALTAAKGLIPSSRLGLWGLVTLGRVVSALPAGVSRAAAKLNSKGVRMHDSMRVPDYPQPAAKA